MKCPRCHASMVEKEVPNGHNHSYFSCEECGGLWLPFVATQKLLRKDFVDVSIYRHSVSEGGCCPSDGSTMALCAYDGLEIDVCKECLGVWLDPKEYEQTVKIAKKKESTFVDNITRMLLFYAYLNARHGAFDF